MHSLIENIIDKYIMKLLKRKAFRILLFEGLGTFIVAYGVGCASIDIDKEDPTNSPSPFLIACSLLGALALTG